MFGEGTDWENNKKLYFPLTRGSILDNFRHQILKKAKSTSAITLKQSVNHKQSYNILQFQTDILKNQLSQKHKLLCISNNENKLVFSL